MPQRFALRFENGERRGEQVELVGTSLTVGRRPGSGLQILDASVSGKHAEFIAISGSVHVRDLGSTNGTRVGAERISECELAHGDQVLIGNVRMVFLDAEVGGPPPLSAPQAVDVVGLTGSPEALGEGVRTISQDKVARSGKRSLLAAAVLLALVGAAAWAALWGPFAGLLGSDAEAGGGEALLASAVEPVEGNLLASGFSFESDAGGWAADERGPVEFSLDSAARRRGSRGLAVELATPEGAAGVEWALHQSPAVTAPRGRSLLARAWVRTDGEAAVRLGLRFEDSRAGASEAGRGATVVWSLPSSASEFEALELTSAVPAGYDTVRLQLLATGLGGVAVDDASLVAAGAGAAAPSVGEYELFSLGEPATVATLFKIDRVLLSDLHARPASAPTGSIGERVPLTAVADEAGFVLTGAAPARLSLRVEAPLVAGGIASMGAEGYRTHQVAFERADTISLLFGTGRDLVRLALATPCRVRGRPEGPGFRIEIEGAATWDLQLVFREERAEARNLAHAARQAEAEGNIGESIARWTQLNDEYPIEQALLEEAEAARARLVQSGLGELRVLRQRVERAEFFRLVELFRECRAASEDVAARFEGTEVEQAARALEAEIVAASAELESDLAAAEKQRLVAIARALEADSPELAARVNAYLDTHFGGRE